jgi:hypothetical protein
MPELSESFPEPATPCPDTGYSGSCFPFNTCRSLTRHQFSLSVRFSHYAFFQSATGQASCLHPTNWRYWYGCVNFLTYRSSSILFKCAVDPIRSQALPQGLLGILCTRCQYALVIKHPDPRTFIMICVQPVPERFPWFPKNNCSSCFH